MWVNLCNIFIPHAVIPFSEVGKKGIELPNIKHVHYVNPVLHVMQVRDDVVLRFTGAPRYRFHYDLLLPLI